MLLLQTKAVTKEVPVDGEENSDETKQNEYAGEE